VSVFLDPWTGKFYGKYGAPYLEMDVGGDAKTVKYISFMMNRLS
jgi:hypothetical protein